MNVPLADKFALFLNQTEDESYHLRGGWSSVGSCVGKQILDKIHKTPFGGHGFVTPGSAAHEFWQSRLKSGMIAFDHFLIIGHEQYVFLLRKDKPNRQSPIDTLVFNLKSNQYEVWDYKSIGYITTVMKKPLEKNVIQLNLYSHLLKDMLKLGYYPKCRLIYIDKINWENIKIHSWTGTKSLALRAIERIEWIEKGVEDFEWAKSNWERLTDGLNHWSQTKRPYRTDCKYCEHNYECLKYLGDCWDLKFKSVDDYTYFLKHKELPGIKRVNPLPRKTHKKKPYSPPNIQIDEKNEKLY